MLQNYFKIAWRNIVKHKFTSVINILGLSLGITACLLIYIIASFELSYDNFHPEKKRIYRIVGEHHRSTGESRKIGYMPDPMAIAIRNELTGFETVAGFYNYYAKVTVPNDNNEPKKFEMPKYGIGASNIIVAEPQYFDIFKYQWLAGNQALSFNEPFKVVLSENEARKYFGEQPLANFIGKKVIYNDSLELTVSGIVKDWPGNTDFAFKDFISFKTVDHSFLRNDINLNAWGMWNSTTQAFVKLANNVTPAQAEAGFPGFLKRHIRAEAGSSDELKLQPLSDIHFNEDYEDSYSRKAHLPTLYALMGIALFILIIAAINFINLSTAQSVQRAKEIGIRKVLGSSRRKLIWQFLGETFMLTCLAVILSILIVNPILSLFHSFIPNGLIFSFTPSTCIFLALVILITSLLAGFYPAKMLSSYLPVLSLKGQVSENASRKSYLRKSLIVFQFTISLIFIIGTLVIGSQIHFLLNKDMGFKKDAILNIETRWENRNVLVQKIKQIPNVEMVSISKETPAANDHNGTDLILYKGLNEIKVESQMQIADENFIPLYEIKLLAGRNINHCDTMKELVINETCVRAFAFKKPEDAIGKFVKSGQSDSRSLKLLPVVGVIADFHSQSLHAAIMPTFIASNSRASSVVSVKLSTRGKEVSDFKSIIKQIEQRWQDVYPNEKFEYSFFDETIASFYDKEQKTAKVMNTAMVIAIFISCMGLFGLVTFTAEQRTKEIGIRKVLGASVGGIVAMLSKDFVKLVVVSILIASPVAWYLMDKWLRDFAYRIHLSWWIFVLAAFSAISIALITISFKAIKAAIANPVNSLRTE